MQKMDKNINREQLTLIPKEQEYIQYMLEIIFKLPRIEKFSIGNEYKSSMYQMLNRTMYLSKISNHKQCLEFANDIDSNLNCQRIYLRIMYKNKWIDDKKFQVAISKISELGRMVGGLIKYYAKDNTK